MSGFLEDLYERSSEALHRQDGMVYLTSVVDSVIDEFSRLEQLGDLAEADKILAEADVPRLHADVLDAMLAVTEGMKGLPHREAFARDAAAVIEEVNARIPRRRLVAESGEVISEDVRADARRKYTRQAEEFGRELRETGSLDRHYASKSKA